jgi:UDP-galactopyranose mutase
LSGLPESGQRESDLKKKYEYLIVGTGLFGATFAHEVAKAGKRCMVIDRRGHLAGNSHMETVEGIPVHRYGAHIFHTSDREVWDFVNQFVSFNHFVNSPIAIYKDELYNLPFNMNTFARLWGVRTPAEAKAELERQRLDYAELEPKNLEEQALKLVGRDIYEKLVKGYTEKQWGRSCTELPAFLIRRLPLRLTYDNNYFSDPWQGIPEEGYDALAEKLLEGTEVRLNTEYAPELGALAEKTLYTGPIDAFFDYQLGRLEYRSLRFETEVLDTDNYQGNAVVNYTERSVPYTRIIEHKHFSFGTQPKTVITREYPEPWTPEKEPYYPLNDERNSALYEEYRKLAAGKPEVIFGGRLGLYRYMDMDKTIRVALDCAKKELAAGKQQEHSS